MHGVATGIMIFGTLLAILLNILVRRVNKEEKEKKKHPTKDTGHINEGMLDYINNADAVPVRTWNTKF